MKPIDKTVIPTTALVSLPEESRKIAEKIGVETPPPFNPFDEVRGKYDVLGATHSNLKAFGTDAAVARSMISSAGMTLAGVTRDLDSLAQGVTPERIHKLIRSLTHATKEMTQLRDSRDVQLERFVSREVGVNFFKTNLFDETNKLNQNYLELLDGLASALPRIAEHDARDAATVKELFGEVARILSQPSVLESHLLWHPAPEGDNITSISAVFPGEAKDAQQSARVTVGFQAHIAGENKLATGDFVGAIADFHQSAVELGMSTSVNTAYALTYLADALLMTGLDKATIKVGGPTMELSAEALYGMATRAMRVTVTDSNHPELRRLVEHVHTQLFDADHPEAAMKVTRDALGPSIPVCSSGLIRVLLFPGQGEFD